MGAKIVCDVCLLCRCKWSFLLLHGHETSLERGFMVDLLWVSLLGINLKQEFVEASVTRSFYFESDNGSSERISFDIC